MVSLSARVIVSLVLCVLVACGEVKLRREPENAHVPPGDEPHDAQVAGDGSQDDPPPMSSDDAAVQPPHSSDAGEHSPLDATTATAPDADPITSEDKGDAEADASDPDPSPDEDAGAPEPPDLSCGAFASGMAELAACGSLQPWQAPALPYMGFAIQRADWLPIDGDDGYVALITLKREPNITPDGWVSVYRFDEQGACMEHVGTIEHVFPFYGAYLTQAAARGGTLAVSVGFGTRFGVLGGLAFLANGRQVASVQGETRMDVTPAGEIVIAQTPYHEETGMYGLSLRVLDTEGTLVREAEPASPGLIGDIDASTPGELAVMYRKPGSPDDWGDVERRIDRYGADLSLVGSWLAPEDVVLAAFDVEGARAAVAGKTLETNTVWTQLLELPGWNAAWSQGAEATGLESVADVDVTTDGRVLVAGSTYGSDTFDWLLGYQLDGSTLWSEPQREAPAYGFRAVSGQSNGHILLSGPRGYCDLP